MSAALRTHRLNLPPMSRFSWLMGLYGENHSLLSQLFVPQRLPEGRYRSSVGDGLDLHLDVLACHPYTQELRLSYVLLDPVSGRPDPSAYLRDYRDARQAEATHCYVGRHWQDVLGLNPSAREMMDHRLRMNVFLGKWLAYLAEQGHGSQTLRPEGAVPADATNFVECA